MPRSYLIITYMYAPAISARAFRWSALAERWASQGHQVDVVTLQERDLPAVEILRGVHVHRTTHPVLALLLRQGALQTSSDAPSKTTLLTRVVGLAYRLWRALYWPDAAFLWRGPALRAAKQLASQRRYDAIISVSPFFVAHLVGERVQRAQPAARWLTDYGDPFSFQEVEPHNNLRLYRGLNHRTERRIFRQADAITVTTEPTRAIYAAHFPESAHKIRVIPPLVSASPTVEASPTRDTSRLRLLYTGALYPATRRPDGLLALFAQLAEYHGFLQRVDLHFVGDTSLVRASFAPYQPLIDAERIVLHGVLSREETQREMQQADVLVNIGNRTPYQLPSKVVEYASTGKPILNLMQIKEDSSHSIYASYPNALNLLQEEEPSLEQITALAGWLANLPEPLDRAFLQSWLADFTLESIAAAYEQAIGSASTDAR